MNKTQNKKGYLLENFRLFHLRDAQGTKVDYHYHEFHKILFLISGNGSYVIEGQRYLLKPGDIIIKINDQNVVSIGYLRYYLYNYNVGDKVTITYIRNGDTKTTTVTLSTNEKVY